MRFIPFIISSFIIVLLIFLLNTKWGSIPPLGRFLSPQQGFWQNAEPADKSIDQHITSTNLKGKVNVYVDYRLVPHIFAEHDEDAYFVQGYLHAKFRLWQMDFQTMAAAGRISEILGNDPRFIRFDREQRRLGIGYAAEIAAKEIEKNPVTKAAAESYTAGVNTFINNLTESEVPIEYKLLDYKPEQWSTLKIGLFLKQMSKTLAGHDVDLENTNAKSVFTTKQMEILFPEAHDSLVPIIPKGTVFSSPGINPVKPVSADSLYFNNDTMVNVREVYKPDRDNGSNSWAVSGQKTASGAPILCNDPHLELTLPAIWYEMQITTPNMNVYGATFPGSASVIIGFNDSIVWGFTNAQRDVKDYYEVRFKGASKKQYWFNGGWQPTQLRLEKIKVRGAPDVIDTVAYTIFGPVMYDESFTNVVTGTKAIALRWTAHDPSLEGLLWFRLNPAKNFNEFVEALPSLRTPGQNIIFASKTGDIAVWQQGAFPARWKGQGVYLMPGEDSSYMWQGFIPQQENPNLRNPTSGYLQTANQRPVDTTYPYFIPGNYAVSRGRTIDKRLAQMQQITPKQMMELQTDYYSSFAAEALPLLLRYTNVNELSEVEKGFFTEMQNWNFYMPPHAKPPTIFKVWIDSLQSRIWNDEFARVNTPKELPEEQTLMELLSKDSAFVFVDNITTPQVETIHQQVTAAFKDAVADLQTIKNEKSLEWGTFKKPAIYHLLRTVLPFARTSLPVGGWSTTINAIKSTHGPGWRMVVHLTNPIEAYAIYAGGQSGNPGSKYYDAFIDDWAQGKYYKLWVMKETEANDKRVKWKLTFSNT